MLHVFHFSIFLENPNEKRSLGCDFLALFYHTQAIYVPGTFTPLLISYLNFSQTTQKGKAACLCKRYTLRTS
jgi:hypothetical protein